MNDNEYRRRPSNDDGDDDDRGGSDDDDRGGRSRSVRAENAVAVTSHAFIAEGT